MDYSVVRGHRVINVYPRVFAAKFKPAWMELDNEAIRGAMVRGVGEFFRQAGKKTAVIGLSGGLDSAVAAQVAVEALGKKNVVGVALPYSKKQFHMLTQDWKDACSVAQHLEIEFQTHDITTEVDINARKRGINTRKSRLTDAEKNRLGNIKARMRMLTLMDYSAERNGLVIGTGNKSEITVGYCTLWGDTACAVNPLGEIYKTQEFVLARHMGVLPKIVDRVPSAGLFAGQTDEGQMGFRYSELDPLAYLMYDQNLFVGQLVRFGFTRRFIERVRWMHDANDFKFKMPRIVDLPIPEIGQWQFQQAIGG